MNWKQGQSALMRKLFRKAVAIVLFMAVSAFFASRSLAQNESVSASEPASHLPKFDRALGIVPVGEVLSTSDTVTPLSTGEKFEYFIRPTFDPSIAVVAVVGAGFSAQSKVQPAYGGGAAAFGQKTGAIAADYAADSLFAKALLPSLLHQDPRFFRKEDGGAGSRFLYGVSRTFMTRTDSGQSALNTSYLGGLAMTVALSNAYYPDRNRNAADSASRYAEGIGVNAAINVIREFWKRAH